LNITESLRKEEFKFDNSIVNVIAVRNHPGLELAGLKIESLSEGEEKEMRLWLARELEKAGVVKIVRKDELDTAKLYKIHWTETKIQSKKGISSLPEGFYQKLRKLLRKMKEEARENLEKTAEYKRVLEYAKDIVNCRLRKVISIASSSIHSETILRNLTEEERKLYDIVRSIVSSWRREILESES